MKDWYLRQSPRDRLIVNVLAALTVVALLFALIWYPLSSSLAQKRQTIAGKQDTLQFIQGAVGPLRSAAANGGGERKTSDKAPYLLIDQIIREASMAPPQRVEPSGANGARVQFNEVEFDKLVSVIAELELYGLQISTLTVSRKSEGTVSARFNMERS